MSRVVTLLSGGMDSTTLAYVLRRDGHKLLALSFDYGQRHGRRELDAAGVTAAKLGAEDWRIVDLTSITGLLSGSALTDVRVEVPDGHYSDETMRATVVPNRNAIMLNVAIGYAVAEKAVKVAAAMHAGDHPIYPDCRPEFVDALNRLLSVATDGFAMPGLHVYTPFIHIEKREIAGIGAGLHVPWEDTWSCYRGGDIHCGRCGTCVERAEAFALAGVPDPTTYEDPNFWREQVAVA